jgi:hypothetical protein
MRHALRQNKVGCSWERLVGYTVQELKAHLEAQFESQMSWDNYGRQGWTIDHIIPVSRFLLQLQEPMELRRCFALSNLMPRWHTSEIARLHGSVQVGNSNKQARLIS